jgi:hypothetical protein
VLGLVSAHNMKQWTNVDLEAYRLIRGLPFSLFYEAD